MKGKITVIDLPDHDTVHALEYLLTLAKDGRVSGMLFALAMKGDRKHPHLCGATGRLSTNQVEAAGISAMLSLKMVQESLDISLNK